MKGIYQIIYKGKCAYVGSALDIQRRFRQHKDTLKRKVHKNFILQRMWNKNENDFVFHILEEVLDNSLLMEKEQYHMDTLKPFANISKANGSHPHTEEAKKKMRGRVVSEATKKLLSDKLKGRVSWSKGKKIQTNTGKTHFKKDSTPWNKGVTGYATSYRGIKLSEEHRKKLSEAKKRNWSNPQYHQMMVDAHKIIINK
jgi:group I intron endonuclease